MARLEKTLLLESRLHTWLRSWPVSSEQPYPVDEVIIHMNEVDAQ